MASSLFFDVSQSSHAKALWFEKTFGTARLGALSKIMRWVLLGLTLLFLATFVPQQGIVSAQTSKIILGVTFLVFAWAAALFLMRRFAESLAPTKPPLAPKNLADLISFSTASTSHEAMQYGKRKKLLQLDSLALLHMFLQKEPCVPFLFQRLLLDLKWFQNAVQEALRAAPLHPAKRKQPPLAPDFLATMQAAVDLASKKGRVRAEAEDVFAALALHNPFFNRFLVEQGLVPERDIPNVADWYYRLRSADEERKKFWLKKNLRTRGTLARDWAAGYSITLDQFAYDISEQVLKARFPKAVGHEAEKKSMERALSRANFKNVLLVGNPGSGRRRLIEDFASQSALGEHANPLLNHKRVLALDIARLQEEILNQACREVLSAGNIILVVEDFHNVAAQGLGPLDSYLRSPAFPFIATTTFAGLHRYIQPQPSLLSFFQQVEVTELSKTHTLAVLQEMVPAFEHAHGKAVSYPALQKTIEYADKYIQAVPFPKKALDLLEEAMSYLATLPEGVLLPSHVAAVVSERTKIPVGDMESTERQTLLDLEELMHKRIINQEQAVKEVAAALRRARTQIASRSGPMGSFLFLGPTGVGKTETAKALAALYFGSESRIIRLDMSEFQSVLDVARLLGNAQQDGLLSGAVRQDPFSLLLLDELEKAHPNILNLFLQVLDEGHVTDGLGRKTDFRHTIIIATSNAGYQLILRAIKEQKDFARLKREMLEYVFQQGLYRPEFINRFDGVILFTPLSQEHLLQIAGLMLGKLQENLKEKGIELEITEELKAKIAQLGYDPTFGARNMRRVLQDKVENSLAVALLANRIKRGDRVTIEPATFEVKSKA